MSAASASAFLESAINQRLAELRRECALARHMVRDQRRCHWGWWPTAEADRRRAIRGSQRRVREAEQALRAFIAEHRPLMGSEWPGTDHGRLCWDSFIGGLPIDLHFCQQPENHDGHHADQAGAWRQRK